MFYNVHPQAKRSLVPSCHGAEYAAKNPKNSVQVSVLENLGTSKAEPIENRQKLSPVDQGKLVEYAWWLQKQGRAESTVQSKTKLLRILMKRGAELNDPESVKAVIARQPWCPGRKNNGVDAYSSFLRMVGGKWEPPQYKKVDKVPYVPPEGDIDQLVAACSTRVSTFMQLLKETGARPGEAWVSSWNDVNLDAKAINITPEKGSNARILPLSKKLVAMLEALPRDYGSRVFSSPGMPLDHFRDNFEQQRTRIAQKLQNPKLKLVTFKTLRHFKGTLEYHRTKDIVHVMHTLGHKNIKNTLVYVHLAEQLFRGEDEYVSRVARTLKEACALISGGFEFVCEWKGDKLFRKRKY
jgi:integrase